MKEIASGKFKEKEEEKKAFRNIHIFLKFFILFIQFDLLRILLFHLFEFLSFYHKFGEKEMIQ
jgi:hypothetical protein